MAVETPPVPIFLWFVPAKFFGHCQGQWPRRGRGQGNPVGASPAGAIEEMRVVLAKGQYDALLTILNANLLDDFRDAGLAAADRPPLRAAPPPRVTLGRCTHFLLIIYLCKNCALLGGILRQLCLCLPLTVLDGIGWCFMDLTTCSFDVKIYTRPPSQILVKTFGHTRLALWRRRPATPRANAKPDAGDAGTDTPKRRSRAISGGAARKPELPTGATPPPKEEKAEAEDRVATTAMFTFRRLTVELWDRQVFPAEAGGRAPLWGNKVLLDEACLLMVISEECSGNILRTELCPRACALCW